MPQRETPLMESVDESVLDDVAKKMACLFFGQICAWKGVLYDASTRRKRWRRRHFSARHVVVAPVVVPSDGDVIQESKLKTWCYFGQGFEFWVRFEFWAANFFPLDNPRFPGDRSRSLLKKTEKKNCFFLFPFPPSLFTLRAAPCITRGWVHFGNSRIKWNLSRRQIIWSWLWRPHSFSVSDD